MIDPCWICDSKLETETDGNGQVHVYCSICRPRLAALEEVAGQVVRLGTLIEQADQQPRRRRASPHDWPRAKLLYEQGMAQVAIGRLLGIPIKTLYNIRSAEKWTRTYAARQRREGVTV